MIIGINGYIGSGKDTVGKIVQWLTIKDKRVWEQNPYGVQSWIENDQFRKYWLSAGDWEIKKFAGKLKQIASLMTGIPIERFEDQEFKKTYLPDAWAYLPKTEEEILTDGIGLMLKRMTVREFLQRLGTEAIRDGLHTNAWVNALFADYKPARIELGAKAPIPSESNWIITDCRFPNEAQAIKDRGGIVVRIDRFRVANFGETHLHPSETSLDDWKFDARINNNGTIEELVPLVGELLKRFNIT